MFENSKELYQWLQNGAYLYVCGDKEHMVKDVHEALISIIEKEGSMSHDEAEEQLAAIKKKNVIKVMYINQ